MTEDREDAIERLQILLKTSELAAIDDFRFENRLPSRSSAIREILRRGLLAGGHEIIPEGSQSRDFGVLRQTKRGEKVKPQIKPAPARAKWESQLSAAPKRGGEKRGLAPRLRKED